MGSGPLPSAARGAGGADGEASGASSCRMTSVTISDGVATRLQNRCSTMLHSVRFTMGSAAPPCRCYCRMSTTKAESSRSLHTVCTLGDVPGLCLNGSTVSV